MYMKWARCVSGVYGSGGVLDFGVYDMGVFAYTPDSGVYTSPPGHIVWGKGVDTTDGTFPVGFDAKG